MAMEPPAAREKARPQFACPCGAGADAGVSCRETTLNLGKHHRLRIRFGEWRPLRAADEQCPECGTRRGGIHHVGCVLEQCPRCEGRLAACSCPRSDMPASATAPGAPGSRPAATALVSDPGEFV